MEIQGQKVVIYGLGVSGRAAMRLARERGAAVAVVDQRSDLTLDSGIPLFLPQDFEGRFAEAAVLVVSPGVPETAPGIAEAVDAGVPIYSEVEFALLFLDLPWVGVTGTNGKSTVTSFVGQFLKTAGGTPFVGGNLGRPLSEAAFLCNRGSWDAMVVEISSYQLSFWRGVRPPKVATILNLTPDHLARHGSMAIYAEHKARLLKNQGRSSKVVLPASDVSLQAATDGVGEAERWWSGVLPGVLRAGPQTILDVGDGRHILDFQEFSIPAEHNVENASVAALLAHGFGVSIPDLQAAIPELQALPHRMEIVATADGVTWINDSKATNVAAVATGLSGLEGGGVLLLGGQAKGESFQPLIAHLALWKIVCFGGSGVKIASELNSYGVTTHCATTLENAVDIAETLVCSGDIVLLSPACASFDAFENFEHRGRVFSDLARKAAERVHGAQ